MFYSNIRDYKPDVFKRLTGVSKETFVLMIDVLRDNLPDFGRPPELCLQDRLLLVLMYWREYRSQAHIAATYGVSEATVSRTIKRFEDILIKDNRFHLPGKKALRESDTLIEVVLIDATECPCERPKKDSAATTPARRNATPTRLSS
jgi:hypothetical protein